MAIKYIFVTGGVVSSLGKGITAASLGRLLKARGYKVSMQKMDPYLNFNPGMMSPYQHGEVFVTDDGTEADLDLGHYERFIDETLTGASSVTTGKVYWTVINRERQGDYKGGTVQVIPHVTNEIKKRILALKEGDTDVAIIEIGGTVGDIEGGPYLESIRQLRWEVGVENCCFIHVTLLPYIAASGEIKTKPTQHSVKELRSIGIQPDILVCRTERAVTQDFKEKIALFCNVEPRNVVQNRDVPSLYSIPLMLEEEGMADAVCRTLRLEPGAPDLADWRELVEKQARRERELNIALVGKYVELHDAYLSCAESLEHAGIAQDAKIHLHWIQSEDISEANVDALLGDMDGIFVPGGFGSRGTEGIIRAIRVARTKNIPYFGLGFGMQLAAVEFARNVLGLHEASSTEIDPETPYPVVYMPDDRKPVGENDLYGQMRIGSHTCLIEEDSQAARAYGATEVRERHRHRYEVDTEIAERFAEAGMRITGRDAQENFPEILEIPGNRFFMGVSFQPEFKSRPNRPHPLFREFIGAAL